MAINFTSAQLIGTGSLITEALDSGAYIKFTKVGGTHDENTTLTPGGTITYVAIEVVGGGSNTVPGLNKSNFTLFDTNGIKLHTAYSTTNFAYVLPRGTYDSGNVTIASSLPTIPANTLRIRAVGIKSSAINMVEIDGDGTTFTGEIGVGAIGTTYKIGFTP